MDKEKKLFTWLPSNKETFYDTYNSIEECVKEAQKQYDEKYEYYEEEDENSLDINLYVVEKYNPEKYLNKFGSHLLDLLNDNLIDYMEGIDVESEVYCPVNKEDEFNQKVKDALLPLINEYVSFHMDMKGTFLELKYNVKYRVYLIGDTEYTEIPEKFKNL